MCFGLGISSVVSLCPFFVDLNHFLTGFDLSFFLVLDVVLTDLQNSNIKNFVQMAYFKMILTFGLNGVIIYKVKKAVWV